MKIIKNIVVITATLVAVLMFVIGIFMITTGSLEEFPTNEQIEKVRIVGMFLVILGTSIEVIIFKAINKLKKNK